MFGSSMSACDTYRSCVRKGRGIGVRRECVSGLAAARRRGSILYIVSVSLCIGSRHDIRRTACIATRVQMVVAVYLPQGMRSGYVQ